MKKYFKTIALAIIIGMLLGLIFYTDSKAKIKEVFDESLIITIVQIGVFNDIKNAETLSKKNSGVVFTDDKHYVYFAISSNEELLNKNIIYLKKKDINYYLKKVNVTNIKFIDYLKKAEKLLSETDNQSVINEINIKILQKYKETL